MREMQEKYVIEENGRPVRLPLEPDELYDEYKRKMGNNDD
jgi:hypothetical protein